MVSLQSESTLYAREVPGYDEAVTPDGRFQEPWRDFLEKIHASPRDEREAWRSMIRKDLRDDGLTYTITPETKPDTRRDDLDALPWIFSEDDWSRIEAGVSQRMRLLELVARDLLGPRDLVRRGLIPADLLFAHGGYLRPCVNLPANLEAHLFFYAADLARGPDGQMWVLDDKTQAPSGAGYALENRTILDRLYPDMLNRMQVRRLAGFFRTFRESLMRMYTGRRLEPRAVLLTPGPYSSTYFEHAYLAAYLGYTLVQGDDLVTRDGALWLKTLEGLQPVDMVIRRLDAEFCDPLELRRDSYLGVPGLLGTMRNGRTACVNHPGTGALENRGIMPFLPNLCRELLGEDPLLPSAATWWCGQPAECSHVLANLDKLIIKPIHRNSSDSSVYGWSCSKQELEDLRQRILANPMAYVVQDHIGFSSVPLLLNGDLKPRRSVLRAFACATPEGPEVMPGGLARSAADPDSPRVAVSEGGILKDVWVLGSETSPYRTLWVENETPKDQAWFGGVFTSRSADNLYWIGRYAERIARQARLARAIVQTRGVALNDPQTTENTLNALAELMELYCGRQPEESPQPLGDRLLSTLRSADGEPGSLQQHLRALLYAAYGVRDIWSQDSWRALIAIESSGEACCRDLKTPFLLGDDLDELLEKLHAFYGLNTGAMTRESGWTMLMLGRTLEAGIALCEMISRLLIPSRTEETRQALMECTLSLNESLITYRRHYRTTPRLNSVLDLLLSMETNPRSLVFLLAGTAELLHQLPPPAQPDVFDSILLSLKQLRTRAGLRAWQTPDERTELEPFLHEVRTALETCSNMISSAYFTHTATHALEAF